MCDSDQDNTIKTYRGVEQVTLLGHIKFIFIANNEKQSIWETWNINKNMKPTIILK
jgi:hypothetical protein